VGLVVRLGGDDVHTQHQVRPLQAGRRSEGPPVHIDRRRRERGLLGWKSSPGRGPRADVVRGAVEVYRLEAGGPAGALLWGGSDAVRAENVAIGLDVIPSHA
jgi:hypothetical protein